MVHPYWVGHSSVTSADFGLTACSGLWLLASVQVDCVSVTAVLILHTSSILFVAEKHAFPQNVTKVFCSQSFIESCIVSVKLLEKIVNCLVIH